MKCTFSYVSEQPLNLGRDHLPRELPKLQQMFTLPLHPLPHPSITKKHLMATPTVFIRDSLPTDPPTREAYKHFSNGQQPHHIYFPTTGKAITFNFTFFAAHFTLSCCFGSCHSQTGIRSFHWIQEYIQCTVYASLFGKLLGTYNYDHCHVERNR